MSLINCKVHLELNWTQDLSCLVLEALQIWGDRLHVPIVTLSTKGIVNLTKLLSEGFKRSVSCNSYQIKPAKIIEKGKNIYKLLNASFQGVRVLFVLAYVVAASAANDEADIKDNTKYFLARGEIYNHNVLIDGRNFYDQTINGPIKQYDEVRKVSTGHGHDYRTGSLLDYAYF